MFGRKTNQPNEIEQPDFEVFVVYDSKSRSYNVPVFETNKDVLMRNLLNMFNDPQQVQNMYLVNAEDYSIFKIGSYYKKTGQLLSQNAEHVANMHDLRALSTWKPNMTNVGPNFDRINAEMHKMEEMASSSRQ